MSHHDFIRRSATDTLPNEAVLGAQDFARLDAAQFRSVNGDDGGLWTASKPVIIGGNSTSSLNLTTAGSQLTGGAKTTLGGRIVLGANDFPAVSPARSRSITLSPFRMQQTASRAAKSRNQDFALSLPPNPVGVQIFTSPLQIAIPNRYLHNGANFASASMRFRMPSIPASTSGPFLVFAGVLRDLSAGQTFHPGNYLFGTVLISAWTATTAFAIGAYVKPTTTHATGFYYKRTLGVGNTGSSEPAWPTVLGGTVVDGTATWTCTGYLGQLPYAQWQNPVTYRASGQAQTLQYTTDPATFTSNVIDTSTYKYLLLLGADYGAILHSVTLTFNNITSTAFE